MYRSPVGKLHKEMKPRKHVSSFLLQVQLRMRLWFSVCKLLVYAYKGSLANRIEWNRAHFTYSSALLYFLCRRWKLAITLEDAEIGGQNINQNKKNTNIFSSYSMDIYSTKVLVKDCYSKPHSTLQGVSLSCLALLGNQKKRKWGEVTILYAAYDPNKAIWKEKVSSSQADKNSISTRRR